MKELAGSDDQIDVVWRAFELRPEPIPTLPPKGEYLQRVWNNSVYPMAERFGQPMRLPPVQPRSRRAHEAAKWAGSQGRLADYNRALFQALFERGEDIGRIEVLTTLASSLGMQKSTLAHALEAREFEPDVLADEQWAAALGLGGVPAFVANRSVAITGVQPLSELQRLIRHARGLPNPPRASPVAWPDRRP